VIAIEKLRYVRLGVPDLVKAATYASGVVGLERAPSTDDMALFRSDYRDHTVDFYFSDKPEQTLALEVRSPEALAAAVAQLNAAGYAATIGDAATCKARRCKGIASFRIRGGITVEIVVRPMHSGWRYFASRDAGITEFFGVAIASTDVAADTKLFTEMFNGKVTDYLGEAVYIAIDDQHHRIAIHPSDRDGILEVQFKLEGMHELMQNSYFLQSAQVPIAHGPGRRAASEQVFLSFKGIGDVLFGFVAEGLTLAPGEDRLPRQFPRAAGSYCTWGSLSQVPEYSAGRV
jgi:2,3-dihydroxy-p-cumate/2,3-dihydroxybenzoate 3,4-dioxygenase